MIEIESKESSNLNGKWTRARRAGVGGITGSWIFYTKDPGFPKILVGFFSIVDILPVVYRGVISNKYSSSLWTVWVDARPSNVPAGGGRIFKEELTQCSPPPEK